MGNSNSKGQTGTEKPTTPSTNESGKQSQWDAFDKSLDRAFGKKKGDGSNRD